MNDKKQHLIDTALNLFYQRGINSIGINEVLKVSGIAKKTLYNHFKSKDDLVLATLEYRDQQFMAWFDSLLSKANNDDALITQLFEGLHAWFTNGVAELQGFRGCFFINTAGEFTEQHSTIKSYCSEHKQKVKKCIEQHLSLKDKQLVNLLVLLKEGAIVQAHLNQDLAAPLTCIPIAKQYLASLDNR